MTMDEQYEKELPAMDQNGLVGLLYSKSCPVGYKCLAMDCMKCLELYADGKGEAHGHT